MRHIRLSVAGVWGLLLGDPERLCICDYAQCGVQSKRSETSPAASRARDKNIPVRQDKTSDSSPALVLSSVP